MHFKVLNPLFQNKNGRRRDIKETNATLSADLRVIKHDIAYLSDLFDKLNEMNLQLQGNEVNLIKAKSVISTFVSKSAMFKRNIGRRELYQFPNLSELEK
jgi:hypothetical protein